MDMEVSPMRKPKSAKAENWYHQKKPQAKNNPTISLPQANRDDNKQQARKRSQMREWWDHCKQEAKVKTNKYQSKKWENIQILHSTNFKTRE